MKKFEKVFKNIIKEDVFNAKRDFHSYYYEPTEEQVYNRAVKELQKENMKIKQGDLERMAGKIAREITTFHLFEDEEDYELFFWDEYTQTVNDYKFRGIIKESKIIKEDLDDIRKQQIEKIIESCDERFRSSKFAVIIGRGNGDYNSPLRVELIHQGIPVTMVNYYQDCEGGSHIIPAPEIENLIRKVKNTLEENGIRFFDIEVS